MKLIIVLSILLFTACTGVSQNKSDVGNINKQQLEKLVEDTNVIIMDVRTPEEVSEGYIKGTSVFLNFYDPEFDNKISGLDKNKTYIIYCRSGSRSSKAGKKLIEKGFKKVHNLEGGISGWNGEIIK